ncbi:conserved hypothetical protein [Bosea sp. EC-HK365B]|nr:conserved hypothetical protein [Bosea sp. 21B]CAD5285405.1 conserved hypothetical protein [Bosea sp. 7B]VVT57647.1 conserved hypothetical protein [Bosea sp. EC-HK365B]VXC92994.1 conserved hypothetical protein [Bosea sp. 127]
MGGLRAPHAVEGRGSSALLSARAGCRSRVPGVESGAAARLRLRAAFRLAGAAGWAELSGMLPGTGHRNSADWN